MDKIKNFVLKHWDLLLLVIFVSLAVLLRFAHVTSLQFFTYDQSRDALFIKRMIVNHEFRLLGTQTSLPGMYLPPFYFYTLVPILWLFQLNPVGIDIYSATIGILTVPLVFFVANKIFGRPAGIFSAGLFAVSPLVVELTRRAWNPNTLPFFILISFYFLYSYFKERKTKNFLLAFGFYGYCLSLHFGAWTLAPLFIFSWFFFFFKNRDWKGALGSIVLIFFFISPLLLFELRHNFFLSSQAKIFFFDGGHIGLPISDFFSSFLSSLIAIFTILISGKIMVGYAAPLEFSGEFKNLFRLSYPISVVAQKPFSLSFQWWGIAIFVLILLLSLSSFRFSLRKDQGRKNRDFLPLMMLWVWILWGVFASRMYGGKFFFFYYLFLFPAPILLFGFLGRKIWEVKLVRPLAFVIFLLIIAFHLKFTTVFAKSWRDINDLRQVAEVVGNNVSEGLTFNIATIQRDVDRWDRNSVDYRYFVETFGHKRALDWYPEDYEKAKILFVIDENGQADVFRSNIMEIEKFRPNKIISKWAVQKGIVIYKLSKKEK